MDLDDIKVCFFFKLIRVKFDFRSNNYSKENSVFNVGKGWEDNHLKCTFVYRHTKNVFFNIN